MANLKHTDFVTYGRHMTMRGLHIVTMNRCNQAHENPDSYEASDLAARQVAEYARVAGVTWDEALEAVREGRVLRKKA